MNSNSEFVVNTNMQSRVLLRMTLYDTVGVAVYTQTSYYYCVAYCLMSYMHVMQIFLPNPIPFNKFWNTNSSC